MTEQQLSKCDAVTGPSEPVDIWRNEVQDRLARYKRRRGRRIEGAYTMRFPFPAEEAGQPPSAEPLASTVNPAPALPAKIAEPAVLSESPATAMVESVADQASAENLSLPAEDPVELVLPAPRAPANEPAVFVDPVSRPRPKRKVIAFPKQPSVAPEQVYRLADPVSAEVPRILDVPEELEAIPATPFLDGLGLDARNNTSAAPMQDHVELPYKPVRVSRRIAAAATDLSIVVAGVGAFATVAYRLLEYPPLSRPLGLGLAAAFVVLWSAYQYLFLVYAGKTLGMTAARLHLRSFKGKTPRRDQRRLRVLSLYFSILSLGMGLMWAFADVDGFCWHDRLSRTFLTHQE